MLDANGSCIVSEILGVFPVISGFSCTDYALFIGGVGMLSSYIFWIQVTK